MKKIDSMLQSYENRFFAQLSLNDSCKRVVTCIKFARQIAARVWKITKKFMFRMIDELVWVFFLFSLLI